MCIIPIMIAIMVIAIFLFTRTTKGLPKEGRRLLLATYIVESACVLTRGIVATIIGPALLMPVWVVLLLVSMIVSLGTRNPLIGAGVIPLGIFILGIFVLVCAIGPLVWSVLHVIGLIGSSKFDRFIMKARSVMDEREQPVLISALAQIQNVGAYKMFSGVYVVSSWLTPRFEVIGTDLFLAKCLLHDERKYLTAVLAHALGWVNSVDGRLVMALRRLVVPPVYLLSWMLNDTAPGNMIIYAAKSQGYTGFITVSILNGFLALSGGGWGQFLLTPWWSKYWDNAAYRADAFAKALGQKQPMIEYLDHNQLFTVATPYSLFAEATDMEPRINALMK